MLEWFLSRFNCTNWYAIVVLFGAPLMVALPWAVVELEDWLRGKRKRR